MHFASQIPAISLRRLSAMVMGALLMAAATVMPQTATAEAEAGEMPEMVVVTPSPHGFAETVDAFREAVAEGGWSLLNETNMAGVLSARGHTLDPVIIFDACSGQYSAQILGHDEARPMSAFMPCRVSIYKTSEGDVFFARMNTAAFAAMLDPMVAEVMTASDAEISEIIDSVVR